MGSGLVLAAYDTAQGLTSLAIAALIALIVSVILAKFLGVRGVWSRFVLKDEQRNEQGYVAPKDQSALIGEEGVAVTPLRPAGIVKIDGKRVDAVSVGGFIAAGTPLVVVEVEGARVVVAEKEVKE
jgi:membrane-bound serine protease (ClpP class)